MIGTSALRSQNTITARKQGLGLSQSEARRLTGPEHLARKTWRALLRLPLVVRRAPETLVQKQVQNRGKPFSMARVRGSVASIGFQFSFMVPI